MINCYVGKTGSGKSYEIKRLVHRIEKNLVLFDVHGEVNNAKRSPFKFRNAVKCTTFEQFKNYRSRTTHNLACRFNRKKDYIQAVGYLALDQGFTLVCDELAWLGVSSNRIPEAMVDLVTSHRFRDCVLFFGTQSPMRIHEVMLGNYDNLFIYHLEKAAVDNLHGKILLSDEERERIPLLTQGQCIVRRNIV